MDIFENSEYQKILHKRTDTVTLGSNIESAIWGINWENCGNMIQIPYNTKRWEVPPSF